MILNASDLIARHGLPSLAMKALMTSKDYKSFPLTEMTKLLVLCYCEDKGWHVPS